MIKEIKNLIFLFIICLFVFFIGRYYFSDVNNRKQLHLKLIRNLPLHDPVVNFKILKLFWIKGLIKGDQDFGNVMKMDIKEYMKNLQKNYRIDNCFEND